MPDPSAPSPWDRLGLASERRRPEDLEPVLRREQGEPLQHFRVGWHATVDRLAEIERAFDVSGGEQDQEARFSIRAVLEAVTNFLCCAEGARVAGESHCMSSGSRLMVIHDPAPNISSYARSAIRTEVHHGTVAASPHIAGGFWARHASRDHAGGGSWSLSSSWASACWRC